MQGFGDWMTEDDLLIDLPGVVWINNYPFVLLETDKVLFFSRRSGHLLALYAPCSFPSIHFLIFFSL